MIDLQEQLMTYVEAHTTPQSELLYQLYRETHLKTLAPQMAAGHFQGELLKMISSMIRPKAILEVGTFTGYAALCLAQGLEEGGKLYTIEVNEELEDLIRRYIQQAKAEHQIELHIGDAGKIIPNLEIQFDLVYIDAGKRYNDLYYDLVFEKVRQGGFILIDNVLWSGKVTESKKDKDAERIDAFNKKVHHDNRVENVVLPIRDGVTLVRKL